VKDEKVEYYSWEKNNFWIFYKKTLTSNGLYTCGFGSYFPELDKLKQYNLFQEQIPCSFFY